MLLDRFQKSKSNLYLPFLWYSCSVFPVYQWYLILFLVSSLPIIRKWYLTFKVLGPFLRRCYNPRHDFILLWGIDLPYPVKITFSDGWNRDASKHMHSEDIGLARCGPRMGNARRRIMMLDWHGMSSDKTSCNTPQNFLKAIRGASEPPPYFSLCKKDLRLPNKTILAWIDHPYKKPFAWTRCLNDASDHKVQHYSSGTAKDINNLLQLAPRSILDASCTLDTLKPKFHFSFWHSY